jgi:hypothetical protein
MHDPNAYTRQVDTPARPVVVGRERVFAIPPAYAGYLDQANPSVNYAGASSLQLYFDSQERRRAFLWFPTPVVTDMLVLCANVNAAVSFGFRSPGSAPPDPASGCAANFYCAYVSSWGALSGPGALNWSNKPAAAGTMPLVGVAGTAAFASPTHLHDIAGSGSGGQLAFLRLGVPTQIAGLYVGIGGLMYQADSASGGIANAPNPSTGPAWEDGSPLFVVYR